MAALRQFLGLTSYYRRFIAQYAKIAHPLHALTRKDVAFEWSSDCQTAFETLKEKLVSAPVLCYPNFHRNFVLETDASVKGLGAVLSQEQEHKRLHPIAYASRALSPAEKNYSITELETLAVVWAAQRFHAYLYNHDVLILTDHSAVKAILGTPSLSGKHARWWTKLHGAGFQKIEIRHRAGRENLRADALSRNPSSLSTHVSDEELLQVANVTTTQATPDFLQNIEVEELLASSPETMIPSDYAEEQWKVATSYERMKLELRTQLDSPTSYEKTYHMICRTLSRMCKAFCA